MYKEKRRVVFEVERKTAIIHDVHEGIGDNSTHRGRESTYQKLSERFFWHGMIEDIKEYIKICKSCQQQGMIFKKITPELKSIPVPNEVMKQIGIDLYTLPEVDGFKHLIVCIDYFSKWSEAKAVKDKSAPTAAKFLCEIICRHGCMRIQINDQGKEFVNEVFENLHETTGTEQRITSAYHPQSSGLCERQNCTFFFFTWVFFHDHSQFAGLQGKGEGISLTPHYHFHPLHRHLDISRAITAESSPLHIAISRIRTGNLWFPSSKVPW